jgi:uncharacterized protein (UPF0332 family)
MNTIAELVEKAKRFLLTAEKALEMSDYDSCASRCYYAMFFVAEAALLTKGLSGSSHKGVLSLFSQHFVKTGIFPRSMGRLLNDAYDKRIVGDYGIGFVLEEEEVRQLLIDAHSFVQTVSEYLANWQQTQQTNEPS